MDSSLSVHAQKTGHEKSEEMARREGDGRREGVMRGARVAAAAAMASFSKVNRVLATLSFSGPNLEANLKRSRRSHSCSLAKKRGPREHPYMTSVLREIRGVSPKEDVVRKVA